LLIARYVGTRSELFEKRLITQTAVTGLHYKAAADTSPRIRCADIEGEIVLSGVHLDTVSRVAECNPGDPATSDDLFLKLQNFFKEVGDFILSRESYVTGEPVYEVQWRTLIANCSTDETFTAPEEYGEQYRVCRQIIEDLKLEGRFPRLDDMNSYFKRLFLMMVMYKLCETQTGLVGMVPLDTMVGGSVSIFTGGAMPFILRSNTGIEGKFQVVGGSYIHGIMNGEAVQSDKWKEEDITLW
jgi:hypothetical protein